MLAPEYKHFADNAAKMLADGNSPEDVVMNLAQMEFDSTQIREICEFARDKAFDLIQEKVPKKSWWKIW